MKLFIVIKHPYYGDPDNVHVFRSHNDALNIHGSFSISERDCSDCNLVWLVISEDGSRAHAFPHYNEALNYKNSTCIDHDYQIISRNI